MSFRLGIVGLCTSHPEKWVPLIRKLAAEADLDVVIRAVWDSAQVRPEGFAREFGRRHDIPHVLSELTDMLDRVDGVIIHSLDWDSHVSQTRVFVEAGKSVMIDKPLIGNLRDARQLVDWAAGGSRITGGSSLRFAQDAQDYAERAIAESDEPHTVFGVCGTDDFGYGIHGYALLCALLGQGIKTIQHLGASVQSLVKIRWSHGAHGILAVGGPHKLPFQATAVSTGGVTQLRIDPTRLYQSLLGRCIPYLIGRADDPPLPMNVLLEPELAALAALKSLGTGGREVALTELDNDDPGYQGAGYAVEYRKTIQAEAGVPAQRSTK